MNLRFVNIEAERARKELSKESLAQKLGVSTKTYYNWINGDTPIPSTALINMSELFNKDIDYLLRDKPPNQPERR
ncbi:helix-turn-helix domain-containing protein [Eubacterium limosum]|uniref:helix-turn-helix domain-containing protein n=1 Tax=Eubacterium limosum TaxID=1736 RepID=UPI003B967BB0